MNNFTLRVIGDPGHGGDQPGAVYGGHEEEDITLAVGLRFSNVLRELGHEALLTRDRDETLTITQRLKMIDQFRAEAFVSIHCNAYLPDPNVQGCETYYRDAMDFPLANCIQQLLAAMTGGQDRRIFQDEQRLGKRLGVLNDGKIPSALVEIGYLTNPANRTYLIENINTIGEVLAHGVDWFAHEKAGIPKTVWPS